MHECDAFIAFATHDYGENTGNSAATDKELDFWQSYMMRKGAKTLIPVRMIPWGEEFDFLAARVLFNMNNIVITWIKGDDFLSHSHALDIVGRLYLPYIFNVFSTCVAFIIGSILCVVVIDAIALEEVGAEHSNM